MGSEVDQTPKTGKLCPCPVFLSSELLLCSPSQYMSNQLAQQLTIMTGKLYCATYGILLIRSRKVSCRIILVKFHCTLRYNHSIYNVHACCPVAIRARFIKSDYMYVSFLLVYHRRFWSSGALVTVHQMLIDLLFSLKSVALH